MFLMITSIMTSAGRKMTMRRATLHWYGEIQQASRVADALTSWGQVDKEEKEVVVTTTRRMQEILKQQTEPQLSVVAECRPHERGLRRIGRLPTSWGRCTTRNLLYWGLSQMRNRPEHQLKCAWDGTPVLPIQPEKLLYGIGFRCSESQVQAIQGSRVKGPPVVGTWWGQARDVEDDGNENDDETLPDKDDST